MRGLLRRLPPALALLAAAAGAALALAAASCSSDDGAIEVAAASSLRHVLPRIVEDFRRAHPGVEVELRFNGSQVLATQIEEGADADLFISANALQASRLVDEDLARLPTVVTANRLVVAVADDAPWQSVEELAAAEASIAVGSPSVPVGALTVIALAQLDAGVRDGLLRDVVTEDPSVRVVLSRLELGEVDAAFVYHSDVAVTRGVRALALPPTVPPNAYVAVLVDGADPQAEELLAFLLGPDAQGLFQAAGFLRAVAGVEAR